MGVIKLLGAAVADQIAAGEVVNRPSSVVKELMENSVDAAASNITLIIQEAGHTLVQVIDDGAGMSPQDAIAAFQRHATSKIATAEDLYKLTTFGFRGEALPSISSVAQVEMRTRREEDDLGVELNISASTLTSQKNVHCPKGTSISVRNLFFNTPARRKFLKSPSYERRVIISEFEKIALANPHITFTLQNENDPTPIVFRSTTLRQRVAEIVKKTLDRSLLPIDLQTPSLNLKGWISSPQQSGVNPTKNSHFFVNGRFMRNTSLQKAVAQAYGRLLPQGHHPYFYIFLEIDPAQIDVNIHPTKTEIKFEDEQLVWQMVNSAVRKGLGSASVAPSIDFANPVTIDIPAYRPLSDSELHTPRTTATRGYNPFSLRAMGNSWNPAPEFDPEQIPFREDLPPNLRSLGRRPTDPNATGTPEDQNSEDYTHNWEEMPSAGFNQEQMDILPQATLQAIQYGGRYLLCPLDQGVAMIDYPRAVERIAFEKMSLTASQSSQMALIPEHLELSTADAATLSDAADELSALGFEIGNMGNGHITVCAMPAALTGKITAAQAIEELLETLGNKPDADNTLHTKLIAALARSATRVKPRQLSATESSHLITELLQCSQPGYTPAGLPIISMITTDEIEKRLKKR